MNKMTRNPPEAKATVLPMADHAAKPQTVLVLQGGGALGAYQAGVYQALVEGGINPDWVIGTSIGAINAVLIAGNKPEDRLPRLQEFWDQVGKGSPLDLMWSAPFLGNAFANMNTIMRGIPGFFEPNPTALFGVNHAAGVERASYYTTDPLKKTLDPAGRFRLPQREAHTADRRRRQRQHQPAQILRHARNGPRSCACHGVGSAAPGLPGGLHRWRALLGWRRLLEHAHRSRARRAAAPQTR